MIAIYARQSVEKENSISIETQIAYCQMKVALNSDIVKIYQDEGYSGSNKKRPAFQRLMQDIENDLIQRVIVYRLDRISRSLTDFADITKAFEQHHVSFTSVHEDFDTTSAIGRAMLAIVMIFAQLERETIQERVKDAFYARMKQGFYVSGVAPIGFKKVPHEINGISTQKLEADPVTVPLIVYLYQNYDNPFSSIGNLVKEINQNYQHFGLKTPISSVRISRILRNPVYVRADEHVYHYLKNKGAEMVDDLSEFNGVNGCTVYGNRHSKTTGKFTDLTGDYVKLGWHEGLISSKQWLDVQEKLDHNKQLKNSGKGSHSWLSGIVKCGYCGYALTVVSGQKNKKRYISCGGRRQKICYQRKTSISFEELEQITEQELKAYFKHYPFCEEQQETEIVSFMEELESIQQEETAIAEKLLTASNNDFTEIIQVLDIRLKQLHSKKKQLENQITLLKTHSERKLQQALSSWDKMSMEQKKKIAKLFLSEIKVWNDKIELCFLTEEL